VRLAYRAGDSTSSPRLDLGLDRAGRDYKFSISPSAIKGGSSLVAEASPSKRLLKVDAGGVKNTGTYALNASQLEPSGRPTVKSRVIELSAGESTQLKLEK
jgi:hypothetical protein